MGIERFALFADESGNADEPLRVLAGLSGPLKSLLQLERQLRGALKRHGLQEVKWAASRTRQARLLAAGEFLQLAAAAFQEGRLALDLLIWERSRAARAWEVLPKEEQWLSLYLALVKRVRARWKGAKLRQLALFPDQRTGMRWGRLKRQSGVKSVRESSSQKLALIQLADLIAGLSRFMRQPMEPQVKGAQARKNRWKLAGEFERLCKNNKRAVGLWKVTKVEGDLSEKRKNSNP